MAKYHLAVAGLLLAVPGMLCAQTTGANPSGQPPAATTSTQSTPQATPPTVPSNNRGKSDQNKKDTKDQVKTVPPPGINADNEVPLTAQVGADGVVKGVKPGSLDDVSAVGTRDIGARGLGNWYSTNTEMAVGKEYSMELEKSTKFITDPVITEYVNRIAQNLVKNSDARVPFTVRVIDSDEINAFALPGGFFYVNSGLILNADTEAELAGVMAHEISHVIAHHAMREQTRMNYAQIGTIPLIFVGGGLGYGIYEAANIGIPLTFLQFSRDFEAQADFLGTQYLYRAGYDPQALVDFFEKIENLEKQKPGLIARAFETHPETPDRIARTQDEIATLLPPRAQYLETTSEFNMVKARLARIENKRKLLDKRNGNKPTLRKVDSNSQNTNDPNGQPTLHRRDDSD
jgi:predicted Zn-dependent protease